MEINPPNNIKTVIFKGDTDDYLKWLIDYVQAKQQPKKQKSAKKVAADFDVQKQVQQLEQKMTKVTHDLNIVSGKLADPDLYTEDQQANLEKLTQKRDKLQAKQHLLEHEWYDLSKLLDTGDKGES